MGEKFREISVSNKSSNSEYFHVIPRSIIPYHDIYRIDQEDLRHIDFAFFTAKEIVKNIIYNRISKHLYFFFSIII